MLGLVVLAAGFAALVVDGTRSIAGSALSLTPVSALFASKLPTMRDAIGRAIHPLLWDPVMTSLLRLPVWLALAIVGVFLLWVARRRAPGVGYSTRA